MQTPLRITFHGMDPSDAVEQRVREKLEQLERVSDKLMGCRVVVDRPHRHQHQGALYSVRLELELAGHDPILVNREQHDAHAHEDVYVAIRDAFEAGRRQLQDQTERTRRRTKTHDVPPHGEILRMVPDEDFGFLRSSDGLDVYFHRNAVAEGSFDDLQVGDRVRYTLAPGEGVEGPQASTVVPLGRHHLPDVDSVPS